MVDVHVDTAAATRRNRPRWLNTITFPEPHDAPKKGALASQMVTTAPPASATLRSLLSWTKPSHWPSGEKKG